MAINWPYKKAYLREKKFLIFGIFHPKNGQKLVFECPHAGGQMGMCPHCPDQNFLVSEAVQLTKQHIKNLADSFSVFRRKSISHDFIKIKDLTMILAFNELILCLQPGFVNLGSLRINKRSFGTSEIHNWIILVQLMYITKC